MNQRRRFYTWEKTNILWTMSIFLPNLGDLPTEKTPLRGRGRHPRAFGIPCLYITDKPRRVCYESSIAQDWKDWNEILVFYFLYIIGLDKNLIF